MCLVHVCARALRACLEHHFCMPAAAQVGLGNTCAWKLAGVDTDTTVAVVFEITANNKWVGLECAMCCVHQRFLCTPCSC